MHVSIEYMYLPPPFLFGGVYMHFGSLHGGGANIKAL